MLTRPPGDARLAPADAARLLEARFSAPLVLSSRRARTLPDTLSGLGIAGGAVYDALVGLAAQEHGLALATRDTRARRTYDAVGVKQSSLPDRGTGPHRQVRRQYRSRTSCDSQLEVTDLW